MKTNHRKTNEKGLKVRKFSIYKLMMKTPLKYPVFNGKSIFTSLVLLLLMAYSPLCSQSLSFSVSQDTIYEGEVIVFTNHSTGFDSSDVFRWTFAPNVFISAQSYTLGSYQTTPGENLSGFFNNFIEVFN